MKRILLALATLVLLAVGCTSCSSGPDEIASTVAELRGLTPTSEVEFEFVSPDEFRRRLVAAFEKEYSREQAQIEQEVYVMLGLLEEHQDLYDLLLDLYCEQAVGFYDDESDKLYVVSDVEDWGPLQKIIFAHEYTHALQDQHFDLTGLRRKVEGNSDMTLALQSLIEGDASLTMSQYALAELDKSELQALGKEVSTYETDQLLAAPRFIREQLLFPYEAGPEFLDHVYGGWSNQPYSALPKSTEQVLHPTKYLSDEPQEVAIPDLADVLGEGWHLTHSDVLGEFNLRLYIGQMGTTTGTAGVTEGWDGDRLEYWKNDKGNRLLIMYSIWDSIDDAFDFRGNNASLFNDKYGYKSLYTLEGYSLWKSDGLSIYLQAQDQNVLILISDDEAALLRALYAFPRDTFWGDLHQGQISDMLAPDDPRYVYAIDQKNQLLYFLNIPLLEIERSVDLPCAQPAAMSYSRRDNDLYIASKSCGKVTIYDLDSDSVSLLPYSDTEYGIDIESAPTLRRLYVLSRDSRGSQNRDSYLSIVDLDTGQILLHELIEALPLGSMAFDEDREVLFIAGSNTIAKFSVSMDRIQLLQSVPAGANCQRIAISPDRLHVVLPCGGYALYDFDATDIENVLGEWDVGHLPYFAVFSPDGEFLYATNGNPNDHKLYVMSTSDYRQVRTLDFAQDFPHTEDSILCSNSDGTVVVGFSFDAHYGGEHRLYRFLVHE